MRSFTKSFGPDLVAVGDERLGERKQIPAVEVLLP